MSTNLAAALTAFATRLEGCSDAPELLAHFELLRSDLNLSGLVFLTFSGDGFGTCEGDADSYRFLAACPAAWCQEYSRQSWFAIDPCLLYAQTNSNAATLDEVEGLARSKGQKAMFECGRGHGFASGLVVPAHGPKGRDRMGVLYAAAGEPERFTKTNLVQSGFLFSGVAKMLLSWYDDQARKALLSRVQFTPEDLAFLKLTHAGFASNEIAAQHNSTKAAVDQRLARISARIGTSGRKAAAALCHDAGLFL